MKKLLILILTITIAFCINTSTVSASSIELNPSTKITNIFGKNGDFNSDNDNDGLGDGWKYSSSLNGSINEGVQKVYSNSSSYFGIKGYDINLKIDHQYYISFNLNTNATNFNTALKIIVDSGELTPISSLNASGKNSKIFDVNSYPTGDLFFYVTSVDASIYPTTVYAEFSEIMMIDLTELYGLDNEPSITEFENSMKIGYFSNTISADELLDFSNSERIEHYLYDVPNIFTDFPSAVTMENIIRVAFFIPLMIIFYLLIPLFNFLLSGSATGSILLGLLILAFILREVIRFIDPDFHLYGKNSYYDGYNRSKTKE